MNEETTNRRRFLAYCSATGLTSTLFPGLLWGRVQESQAGRVTLAKVREASRLAGLDFTETEQRDMIEALNRILPHADRLHADEILKTDRYPDAQAAHEITRTACERAGWPLVPIDVPQSDLTYYIEYTERAAGFERFVRDGHASAIRPRHASELRAYQLVPAVDYLQANRVRLALMESYARATRDVDIVIGGRVTLASRTSLNPLTSMTGHPAVALPVGFTGRGTPNGITLVGRLYDEAALLDAARLLELAFHSHGRRPVVGGS